MHALFPRQSILALSSQKSILCPIYTAVHTCPIHTTVHTCPILTAVHTSPIITAVHTCVILTAVHTSPIDRFDVYNFFTLSTHNHVQSFMWCYILLGSLPHVPFPSTVPCETCPYHNSIMFSILCRSGCHVIDGLPAIFIYPSISVSSSIFAGHTKEV